PQDKTLVDLFEEQVLRTPDNIAVKFEGEALSYRELNSQANQLARHLKCKGIGEKKLVALQLDRSPKLFVSLLAILKTGAAYMPVDPSYPADRAEYMIVDAAADMILTESKADTHHTTDIT